MMEKLLVFTLCKTGMSPCGISGYKISKVLHYMLMSKFFLIMSHLRTRIRNVDGCNSINPLSQCTLFSTTIICLYGCVGKRIGAITGGNKLLAICQLIWHKYSHNIGTHPQWCRIITNTSRSHDISCTSLKVKKFLDHQIA